MGMYFLLVTGVFSVYKECVYCMKFHSLVAHYKRERVMTAYIACSKRAY